MQNDHSGKTIGYAFILLVTNCLIRKHVFLNDRAVYFELFTYMQSGFDSSEIECNFL